MRRFQQSRTAHRGLALGVLVCALRLLVVALALHLSGAAVMMLEAGFGSASRADCCSDCPVEKSGKECPPGCPNCHCVHGQIASFPAQLPVIEAILLASDISTVEPPEASAPHAPFLPSLYRPPRAIQS